MTIAETLIHRGRLEGMEKGILEGMEKGIEKGMQKGMQVGRHALMQEITQRLESKGLSWDEISDIVGGMARESSAVAASTFEDVIA